MLFYHNLCKLIDYKFIFFCLNSRFYRSGSLHVLSHLCCMHIHEDLDYWGIDKNLMEACCALVHYPELELSQQESERDKKNRVLESELAHEEDFGLNLIGKCREFLWDLTEYPERSLPAKVIIQLDVLRSYNR